VLAAVFSKPLLGLFGYGFSEHSYPLIVLCVGQGVVVLTGSKALILVMSGEERASAIVLGITAIIHLIISAALIPTLGVLGAAISTTSCVICWSVCLTWISIRNLGIDPTVFNTFSSVKTIERQ